MNQPEPIQSPEEFFAERTARAVAAPGAMLRALNAAWRRNARTAPVAGDEVPASGGHRVQEERATYVVNKVPRKAAPKRAR